MKDFWVIWTYIANHSSVRKVKGESAEQVRDDQLEFFSEDFRKKGKVYVFDRPPVATHNAE